jgi:hypothetical protein
MSDSLDNDDDDDQHHEQSNNNLFLHEKTLKTSTDPKIGPSTSPTMSQATREALIQPHSIFCLDLFHATDDTKAIKPCRAMPCHLKSSLEIGTHFS